jgi:hypothetical protein
MSDLIDAQVNAAALTSAANVAWFSMQKNDEVHVYYADRNDENNGEIDPVFLLAAYVLQDKPHRSGARTTYVVRTGYDVPDPWRTAFAGISHLAQAQAAEDKIAFAELRRENAPPAGGKIKWTKISLSSSIPQAPPPPPSGVLDNLFVPRRTRIADTDENFMLIGDPDWGTHTIPRLYMMAAILLESARGASVVALVADQQGVIRAHGIKKPTDGGCAHAEVRAVFSLKGRLPDGGAIFGTLKPCTMCAGLLHATDPAGRLRKYWVRDDGNYAADWTNISPSFSLAGGYQLDRNCANVRYLKVRNGQSFFEEFSNAYRNAKKVADSSTKRASPEEERKWYEDWAKKYVFPKGGKWASLSLLSKNALVKGDIKQELIKRTVQEKMSLETFVRQHLAFIDHSKATKGRGWRGMDTESANVIMDAFRKYREERFNEAYSGQVIRIIPWNPDSVALSKSVKEAFLAKQRKYQDAEFLNPNVKAVMDYLANYLRQMNVRM